MKRPGESVLTLEISGEPPEGAPCTERRKVFGADGGTIGRDPKNHWVLADAYVSGSHARIRCEGDQFYIEDTSSNGVYVNEQRLERRRPHPLTSGDRLFIDPFEIVASIAPCPGTDPFAEDSVPSPGDAWGRPSPFENILPDVVPPPATGGEVDPLRLLDLESADRSPVRPQVPRRSLDELGGDPLKEHRSAPVVVRPPESSNWPRIPEDYDPISDTPTSVAPVAGEPATERRVADRRRRGVAAERLSGGGPDLAAVLAGAGLEDAPVTPELAAQFGQILRVVVTGVLDVLQARQKTKGEFRISRTVIQQSGNNPLKHSVDVDDALHNLLLKHNPAYLGPVEAFEDAFNDMRNHQIAMLAGVRVAFEAMFAQFDPARLQGEFDRHRPRARKGALAALQGKPDYWEFYREWVRHMADDVDGSFRTLFGEEFARAYEDQLDRLRDQAPARGRKRSKGARE